MNFNVLTTTLTNFTTAFAAAYDRLAPVRNGLLGSLLVIEVVLVGIWWALGHGDQIANVIKKILFFGVWIWITTSFGSLAKTFLDSLVQAGLIAGGRPGDVGILLDPSRIAGYGLTLSEPLFASLSNTGAFDLDGVFIYGMSWLLLMAAFFIMAVQVFLAVLEFYLLMTVASVLLPFAILRPTKFLAEKAIGAVVSAAIKLMVLAFVLAITEPTLRNIHITHADLVTSNELLSVLFTTLIVAALVWKGPSLAASLLAGAPSLAAAEAVAAAGAVATLIARGGAPAPGATAAASKVTGGDPATATASTASALLGGSHAGGSGAAGGPAAAMASTSNGASAASTNAAAGAVTSQPGGRPGGASSAAAPTLVDAGAPTTIDAARGSGGATGAGGQPSAKGGPTLVDGGPFRDHDKTTPSGPPAAASADRPPSWAAQALRTLRSTNFATRAADGPGPDEPATPGA